MIFEPIAIPASKTSGRPKEPNPIVDNPEYWKLFSALPVDAKEGTEGAGLAVHVPGILDKSNKEWARTVGQIREAGYAREPKVTMRITSEQVVGADKKPAVLIKFWAVTFIARMTKAEKEAERKAKEAADAKEAAELEHSETVIPELNPDDNETPEPAPAPEAKTTAARGTARRK